jgi:hypothetical protein
LTERNIPQGAGSRFFPAETPRAAPPAFGANARRIGTVQIDLSTSRSEAEFDLTGNLLWALDASDLGANLTVKFGDQAGSGVNFQRGLYISGVRFGGEGTSLFLTNDAQPGKTITLLYAVVEGAPFAIENPLIAFQQVKLAGNTTFNGVPDVTVGATSTAQIVAADPDRRELTLSNPSDNSREFRIGGSGTVGASQGFVLNPGETIKLSVADAVEAYNPHTAGQNIAIAEATK